MASRDYLSVKEIASMLAISQFTVHSWIREGKLPALKVGRAYRIERELFLNWREQLKVRPKSIDIGKEFHAELSSLYQAWLLDLKNGPRPCSPTTVSTHRVHFLRYIRILQELEPSAQLTYLQVADPKALCRALTVIPATQFATRYNSYSAVRNFTKFLVRQELLEPAVRDGMTAYRPKRLLPAKKTVLHSGEEVTRFFDAIQLNQGYSQYERILNNALAGIMTYAGLRVSEVANLEVHNVDFGNRLIHIHYAKGGYPRMVGINKRLEEMLKAYWKIRPSIAKEAFFVSESGKKLNRQLIQGRISRIAKRAGLKITPHGLRRTFATLNANDGRSLNLIQLALGHRNISTTQQYLMADNRMAAQQMMDW